VSAYLASLSEESRVECAGRCLIVSGVHTWNGLCSRYRDLILVADASLDLGGDTGTALIQKARRAGHAVVYGGVLAENSIRIASEPRRARERVWCIVSGGETKRWIDVMVRFLDDLTPVSGTIW